MLWLDLQKGKRQLNGMMSEDMPTQHEALMLQAIELAQRGGGTTHPNPRVGAVVVNRGEVVGVGWHKRAGGPHAEAVALQVAGKRARGGTLYVTLEPCSAHGRTPACTEAIRRAGIKHVVYASPDPNPQMSGGHKILEAAGISVTAGVLREQAEALNIPFFHYLRTGRPYVIAKAAISLDGKMATRTHHSQWISGEASRLHAQGLRAASDAIIVGAGTLKHDNPSLTVRGVPAVGDVPLRVVMCFETPKFFADCKLLSAEAPTRFYVRSINTHTEQWREAGIEVEQVTSLAGVLKHLAEDGRLMLLLEGGGELHASFLEARFTDELVLYQAPILIGGRDAIPLWSGQGVDSVDHAPHLEQIERRILGVDQMIRGRVIYPD
ncbi:bifunctional diaminohydroxyphosphoribosylaminopyrimidine deaminase/5-amino-6-(5-phosphoribosylamino)uracil reductase [Mariprofundus ferrooxydans]|uniref:Riboflavin biosynthesis protein RibD n=2 Tax=Mariprofundus ferrooxydans TaxID=314344 RepID=Q0F0P6_9PROT|nr:bifunctional diaminohydroxyphosphoribosylaminopyrimidine deaminase/5-amino-6-(5-phosphoribosylamino)uracil reductase RibD [Mariprofundus ferrooxydans]EAU54982.1 RibD [Mariprofundus ferrooxydans PV-1]KON48473.1 bifunctional diaminohydroxyphosphoribosylaminopyrimidine deaminase/5-amino-6-(5-phosphoribosylamino)uracil reductase [Mariprofundus ferrooxydans]